MSTCEAEYYALKEVINEIIYLMGFIIWIKENINIQVNSNPIIFINNEAAKKLTENPEFHKRTKHIDIMYHYIRNVISFKMVKLIHIFIKYEIINFFTKNLTIKRFSNIKTMTNVLEIKDN